MLADSRGAILRAARAAFLERGFATTSLDAVRREAGVSNGSLFHFFPTKNHLARALYVEALSSYQEAVLAALADDPPARAGVERMLDAHVEWVLAHRVEARVLAELREATTIDGAAVDWGTVNAAAFRALRGWIGRGVARGEMAELPLGAWMALVFAPALTLTPGWARGRPPRVPPAVRRALAAGAWAAVKPQPTETR